MFLQILLGRDGQLRPAVKDFTRLVYPGLTFPSHIIPSPKKFPKGTYVHAYLRLRPPLQLSLDVPRKQRLPVLLQDCVRDHRIPIFRVEEETVHVEETCADGGEASSMDNISR